VNYLPIPDISEKANQSIFMNKRDRSVTEYSVTNLYETEKGKVFVPWRCMHCNQPACHSACIVYALEKRDSGHVTWDKRCIGCRLCMMSCPYQIPKHTFEEPAATIQKCNLCYGRFLQGKIPGCVEACPTDALMFGTRRKLLEEGKRRIAQNPGKYINHIYGELEIGGTSTMYLSAVPFDQIGLRTDLGLRHYPEYSLVYLSAIPFIAGLTPIAMLGIAHVVRMAKKDAREEHHAHHEEKEKH
jgi:Fe-S-cluster-containing dehydrogenase component